MSRFAGSAIETVAFLALSGFMPAWAQVQSPDRDESGFSVIPHIRLAGIAGGVDSDFGLNYEDLFEEGVGLDVEVDCLFPMGASRLGPYVTLSWEAYQGKNGVDLAGDTLEPDGLDILSVVAGIKWIVSLKKWDEGEEISGFFHLGFGASSYSAVKGTLTASGVPATVDVFDATTVYSFVLGAGYKHDLGRFFIDIDIGFRFQPAPDNGDLDFGSSTAMVLSVGIGVGLEL